jgi:hypothetical protein
LVRFRHGPVAADRLEDVVEFRVEEHERDQFERREKRGRSEVRIDERPVRLLADDLSCVERSSAVDQSADCARPA